MLGRIGFLGTILIAMAAVTAPSRGLADAAGGSRTIYSGATIVDVRSGALVRGRSIVVRGEKIEAIVSASTSPNSNGTRVVDASGLFVTPGLIDVHQHVALGRGRKSDEAMLRRELFSGVTAIRDMVGDAPLLADMAQAARSHRIPAPDIVYAAYFAGPEMFKDGRLVDMAPGRTPGKVPWLLSITADTDLRKAVADAKATGASGIKIYGNLDAASVRRIAAEAQRQRMPVWAHAGIFPASPAEIAAARPTTMSHVCMLAYQAMRPIPSSYFGRPPFDEAPLMGPEPHPDVAVALDAMKVNDVILDATVWVYTEIERLQSVYPENPPPKYCSTKLAGELTRQAHKRGVRIATGTDATAQQQSLYPALFGEMDLLRTHAGMSSAEVLQAATMNAALAIGREQEMGEIAVGKLANLVFFANDPTKPDADFRSVVLTVKRGRDYWRRDYRPLAPGEIDVP